jgi:hypothetical protein
MECPARIRYLVRVPLPDHHYLITEAEYGLRTGSFHNDPSSAEETFLLPVAEGLRQK